jgi:hypothetical protein
LIQHFRTAEVEPNAGGTERDRAAAPEGATAQNVSAEDQLGAVKSAVARKFGAVTVPRTAPAVVHAVPRKAALFAFSPPVAEL